MVSQSGFTAIQPSEARTWSNSGSGKTNLKTNIVIEDANGNEIPVNELNPMPVWDYLPPNSVIKYEIQTLSDSVGKSDRVQMDISYDNRSAIIREYKGQINALSPEDKKAFEGGSEVIQDRLLKLTEQALIDKSIPLIVSNYSQTITTDSKNGKAVGEIPIPNNWPKAIYNMMIHYGYDGAGEGITATGRFLSNAYNTVSWVVAGVVVVGAIVGTGGAALAVLAPVATTMFVGEMSYAVANSMLWTGYGPATENKHGVSFPDFGFNHAYGFGMDEIALEVQGGERPTLDAGNPYFLIGGGILTLLLLRRLL